MTIFYYVLNESKLLSGTYQRKSYASKAQPAKRKKKAIFNRHQPLFTRQNAVKPNKPEGSPSNYQSADYE